MAARAKPKKGKATKSPVRRPAPRPKVGKRPPPPKSMASERKKPVPARPPSKAPSDAAASAPAPLRGADERRHVLSLSFLRDGDEFLARLETDSGQITELKNRSLDQLLTLVASELEDLLE